MLCRFEACEARSESPLRWTESRGDHELAVGITPVLVIADMQAGWRRDWGQWVGHRPSEPHRAAMDKTHSGDAYPLAARRAR